MKRINKQAGFTLLEILLVVGIIAILAGIVILAINPTKQLGDTRNAQRRSDVLTILNAVYQFSIDHNGKLPTDNPEGTGLTIIGDSTKEDACVLDGSGDNDTATEIVRNEEDGTEATGNTGTIDLWDALVQDVASTTYLVNIPGDPTREDYGTGYHIFTNSGSKRVTVCAPFAENGVEISVTR